MKFLRLNGEIVLNLDGIAFIRFSSENGVDSATVHFLAPLGADGQRVTEVFAGQAAQALRQWSRTLESREDVLPLPDEPISNFVDFVSVPVRKKKGWFFSTSGDRDVILAFVSSKGSCSLRSYDARTGIFLGKTYRPGDYQESFSDVLSGAVELTVNSQPNLERDCKERLPERILSYLKSQIKTISPEESC